ncbi:hypothetical protein ACFE04_029591 [Oxalis oulophora]
MSSTPSQNTSSTDSESMAVITAQDDHLVINLESDHSEELLLSTLVDKSRKASSKKRKSKSDAAESSRGKCVRERWTEEDELNLLQGMIDYTTSTGCHPSHGKFHTYLKNNVSFNFVYSRTRVSDKVGTLRKQMGETLESSGDGEPSFSTSHKQRLFELAKQIWGDEFTQKAKGKALAKGKGKALKVAHKDESALHFAPDFLMNSTANTEKTLALPQFMEDLVKEGIEAKDDNGEKLRKMWLSLTEEELELRLKMTDLAKRKYEFGLAVIRSTKG